MVAHYRASTKTQRLPEELFAYPSDFSATEEWDPGVVEAERLGEAGVGEGTEFRLLAAFLGRETTLTYRIFEHDAPSAFTFRCENSRVLSLERTNPGASDGGTRTLGASQLQSASEDLRR